jgi:hypothetical protein
VDDPRSLITASAALGVERPMSRATLSLALVALALLGLAFLRFAT